jgi:hypothetical protein
MEENAASILGKESNDYISRLQGMGDGAESVPIGIVNSRMAFPFPKAML